MAKLSYRDAGQNLELYNEGLDRIAPLLRSTHGPRVLDGFGGFASLFRLQDGEHAYRDPVLVSSTDGVGTKLKVAGLLGRHDTVGIDLVAMSVNDCLCTGAEPLMFLDYLALPKDNPPLIEQLVRGIVAGCQEAGCALVGGETAILPDFYQPGDYDMAGFCVGVVERTQIVDGRAIEPGDVVLGLASSGLHSNGYSLARKVVFDHAGLRAADHVAELGRTVGDELLAPTRIYVRPVLDALRHFNTGESVIRGLAHITGEGLPGNVPRVLPAGRRVVLRRGSWPAPPVFAWLQRLGNVEQTEMDTVFNQGIGFVLIVCPDRADDVRRRLIDGGVPTWVIGAVQAGAPGLDWESA